MNSEKTLYDKLTLYTLAHADPSFIHQHVVDAYAAQRATEDSKPIKVFFALVGLYLHVERDRSGKEVQQEHVRHGKSKTAWPQLHIPRQRGSVTVADVMKAQPGKERDRMIDKWCLSVWEAWKTEDHSLVSLIVKELDAKAKQ